MLHIGTTSGDGRVPPLEAVRFEDFPSLLAHQAYFFLHLFISPKAEEAVIGT